MTTTHLVYRLYGGENRKGRPDFYSKRVAAASFLLAADTARQADGVDAFDVTLLADGPIPDDVRAQFADRGTVVDLPGGPVGMRKSFVAGLRYPDRAGWPDEDLVYFSEDDYVHAPEAFLALPRAAAAIPAAHYFALYASTPAHPAFGPGVPYHFPTSFRPQAAAVVDGRRWVNVPSTASTLGGRIGSLRADLGIFRQGMLPYPTRYLDHEIMMVFQGRSPYRTADLFLAPPANRYYRGLKAVAANGVLTPFRVAFQARALTRRRRPHLLYAADPNLACHLEAEFMGPGVNWSDIAEQAREWAGAAGFDLDAGMARH